MRIYISPSQQRSNMYYRNLISEKENCEAIAKLLVEELKAYRVEVKLATLSLGLTGRTDEAKAWGADLYVPVHTNCCGGVGPVIFANNDQTMAIAKLIVDALDSIAPVKSNRSSPVVLRTGVWTEMSRPHQAGMDVLYTEINFHDHAVIAPWLMKNRAQIAKTMAKSIALGYGLKALLYYKKGDSGSGVEKLQKDLTLLGYPLEADGQFGPKTDEAVRKFQKDHKLEVDGLAGPITLALIEKLVAEANTPKPDPEPAVPIEEGVYWRVVVLSSPDYREADALRNELKLNGFPGTFVVKYIKP